MATVVLRSQDCLRRNRFDSDMVTFSNFGSRRNEDPNPNATHHKRRYRENGRHQNRGRDRLVISNSPPKNLVMGQVKILKRGEELDTSTMKKIAMGMDRAAGDEELVLSSTDRLGPDPETVQKQIKVSDLKVVDGIYAGTASFLASPPPSSLPFPGFFSKKENNDLATTDLRRLLRLDLL